MSLEAKFPYNHIYHVEFQRLHRQALEDMENILTLLKKQKVPVEYYEDTVTYSHIRGQFPSHTTYVERHPVLLTFIVIGVIVAAAVLFVAISALNR